MNGCAVSVIVPVCNSAAYLRECVDSVIAEAGFPDWEILLADDGSSDESPEIIREYALRYPNIRALAYDGPPWNRGPGAARNVGLRRACGQYVFFLDSDDRVADGYIGKLLQRIRLSDADVVYAGYSMWTEAGVTPFPKPPLENEGSYPGADHLRARKKCGDGDGYVWCAMYRASFLRGNGIFFEEDLTLCEDVLFTLRAALAAERVTALPDFGYHYRQRPVSLVHSGQPLRDAENELRVLERFAAEEKYRTDPVVWHFCIPIMSMCLYNLGLAHEKGAITARQHEAYYRRLAACVDWRALWKNAETLKNRLKLLLWRLDWRAFYPLVRKSEP